MLREFLSAARARRPGELLGISLRSLAHAVRMSPPLALLLAMASVSALALLLLFWFAEKNDYKATLQQGWQAAERAAALTEDYTARAFEISRQVTERAASRIQSQGIDYFRDKNFGELTGLANAAPMIGSIWIFDDQGNAVADSFGPNPPECDVSGHEFYRVLKDGGAAYIAGLIHGKITKELFFSYNLPVRREGRFLGIVQAKFYAENFGKFFGSLGLGSRARFGIYRGDGTPVMRWFGDWASTASKPGSTSLLSHLTQANEGRFEEQAGGGEYLRAYRVLPDFNLAVSAAVARNEVLEPYWHRFRRNLALLGLAYALLAMFAAAAYRAERRENQEARIRDAAEQRLRASEARYRLLVEQCADGILVADAEGRYVDVNPAGCAMLGFKRDEILGRSIPEVFEADERPRIEGEVARLAGGGVELSEWRFLRKDGSVFIGEVLGRKLPDGRIQGIVRDITGRKQAEQRVRESEERLAAALRAGKLGVYDLDLSTGRLKWDRKVYELWGVPQDEPVTYDTFEAGIYPEDRVLVRGVLQRAFDPAGAHHYECDYRIASRSDGALRWIHADGDVEFDGERPSRVAGAVQDITARKNIEEKLRESEERFRGI